MNLSDAIDEYSTYRLKAGFAANTVRAGDQWLRRFLACTGNIQVRSLGAHHGEMFLSTMLSKGYAPKSVNLGLSMVASFCKWARHRRLMSASSNPLATVRYQKVEDKPRRRVPVKDFPRLLDAAEHPQSRIIVSLGLYLFLRSSEIVELRLKDIDLEQGEVRVYQPKTQRWDVMPICAELDAELRRWLTWYAEDSGPLQAEWRLVPARRKGRIDKPLEGPEMNPTARMSNTSLKIHEALRGIGWDVKGEDGEGVHTLRRSGARAWFDDLVERHDAARDGALRKVAAMLHHRSVVQTETYLGLDADREKRDVLLRGERMFTAPELGNVVRLDATRASGT